MWDTKGCCHVLTNSLQTNCLQEASSSSISLFKHQILLCFCCSSHNSSRQQLFFSSLISSLILLDLWRIFLPCIVWARRWEVAIFISIMLNSSLHNIHSFCKWIFVCKQQALIFTLGLWSSALAHNLILTFRKLFSISLLDPELQPASLAHLASTSERFCFYPWLHISLAHHPFIYFPI